MNQLHTLQLGFKNLSKVTTRNLRIFASSSMGSKRNVLDSSKAELIMVEDDNAKGRKRLKALVGTDPNHKKPVLKESGVGSFLAEIESFKDDPERIENMTVQELRTILRSVGVPSKGRKSELVSVLKIFVDKKINGQCSDLAEEQLLSMPTEGVSVETEDEKLYGEDQVEENSKTRMGLTKQKLSVKSTEVKGEMLSQAETSVSSKTIDVGVCNKVGISALETGPWTMLAHKKPQKHWIPYNPRTMRPPPLSSDIKCVKLMSWNVNGLRALLKLEGFSVLELAQREDFDVLCLQETKLQEKDVENIAGMIDGYHNSFWTCSVAKLGYSGTAIISRIKPLSVKYGLGISDHDSEGRIVTAEFDSFYLICGYVPNSGDGLKRLTYRTTQWDPSLSSYMKELEKSKPVILTGDLNCAHQEIDIFNPAGNKRNAGFTIEERQSFEKNFLSNGFVDTFRRQHPDAVGYTYWGYRHGGRKANKGWRLDYFLASESIADQVHDSYIAPDIHGSDHCPIGLVLKL